MTSITVFGLLLIWIAAVNGRISINGLALNGLINGLELNGINPNGVDMNGINPNGVDMNGLNPNGVDINGIRLNGIRLNGVRMNGEMNGIPLDSSQNPTYWNEFNNSALGDAPISQLSLKNNATQPIMSLFHYLVLCALPEGKTWTARLADGSETFNGQFNLAPNYIDTPLTLVEQEWMSACLLSFVNALGEHVLISLRDSEKIPATDPNEIEQFETYEGSFFGNLFRQDSGAFSCQGTPEPQAIAESSDRRLRVCTDEHENCPQTIGYCADHCRSFTYQYGYGSCSFNGTNYDQVVNVFLRTNSASGIVNHLLIVLLFIVCFLF